MTSETEGEDLRTELGRVMSQLRVIRGLSIREVASQIGMVVEQLVAAEQGDITPATLKALAAFYALDEEELRDGMIMPVEGVEGATLFLLHAGAYQDFDAQDLGALERAMHVGRWMTASMAAAGDLECLYRRLQFVPSRPVGPGAADAARQGHKLARFVRSKLGFGDAPIEDIRRLLEEQLGIAVLVEPLVTENLHAASILDVRRAAASAVLAADDPQRANNPSLTRVCLAHELCHLLFDPGAPGRVCVALDDRPYDRSGTGKSSASLLESRAKGFAAEFLIPRGGLHALLGSPKNEGVASVREARAMVAKVRDHFSTPWEIAANHLMNLNFIHKDLSLALRSNKPAPVLPRHLTSLPRAGEVPRFALKLGLSVSLQDHPSELTSRNGEERAHVLPRHVDEARQVMEAAWGECIERVLRDARTRCAEEDDIAAVDLLVDHFDDLFSAGEFQLARRTLDRLDARELPPNVLTGVLMVSAPAREQLGEARKDFCERVWRALAETWHLEPERIERIIRRLA